MPKKQQPAPLVLEPDDLELWYEVWSRHVLFGEGPLDLQRHFAKQGQALSLELVQEAVNWGAGNAVSIMESRRTKLARSMAAAVTRRKLIWGEIQRLQRLQRERGGIPETTQHFDKNGKLTGSTVRTRDASRAILAAEARLGELDKFCAALDGLLVVRDAETDQITAIDVNFDGLFSQEFLEQAARPCELAGPARDNNDFGGPE